ncbi:MAG: aspartate aminotransferase family protein [Trueperaceae bacterium]
MALFADKITDRAQEMLAQDSSYNSGLWNPDTIYTHGLGAKLWDINGNEYIDCMAGIAVASVGHGNERLANALVEQAKKLIVCPQNLGSDTRVKFYEKLFKFIPNSMKLNRVFLANSGSEVNEAALKWARAATGRTKFVAAKRGFTGRTMGALALTWEKKYREPFEPLRYEADFTTYNDLESLDKAVTEETAAVWLEPVQGEGGIHPATPEYLQGVQRICKERGALLIMDEVQSGVGRTGKFLASEHYNIRPDMVTLAKGLGGGVPIGALLMTEKVALKMPKGGHGTTFGGNPLACAAALAVLEEIDAKQLLQYTTLVGDYFQEQLRAISSPKIRTVRGKGLLIGAEMKEKVAPYIAALKKEKVLTINAGATVIRFVPPLVITKEEIDEVIKRFTRVLETV